MIILPLENIKPTLILAYLVKDCLIKKLKNIVICGKMVDNIQLKNIIRQSMRKKKILKFKQIEFFSIKSGTSFFIINIHLFYLLVDKHKVNVIYNMKNLLKKFCHKNKMIFHLDDQLAIYKNFHLVLLVVLDFLVQNLFQLLKI